MKRGKHRKHARRVHGPISPIGKIVLETLAAVPCIYGTLVFIGTPPRMMAPVGFTILGVWAGICVCDL